MADITKVLVDDHLRVKRLLTNYEQSPWRLDMALLVCDELKMHNTIEEEIFYPAVRDAVDERLADESEDEHAQVDEIIAAVEDMDPGDPALERTMRMLRSALTKHIDREENVIFPKANVDLANVLLDMGREAFARRQELMGARVSGDVSPSLSMGTANVGWRTRGIKSATANLGW